MQPNDIRVVIICRKVVAGLGIHTTPDQNGLSDLGRKTSNPFGTHWRVRRLDRDRVSRPRPAENGSEGRYGRCGLPHPVLIFSTIFGGACAKRRRPFSSRVGPAFRAYRMGQGRTADSARLSRYRKHSPMRATDPIVGIRRERRYRCRSRHGCLLC